MARRYHYDAKGRLKGYSTNKFQYKLRDIFILMGVIAVGSWLGLDDKHPEKSNLPKTTTHLQKIQSATPRKIDQTDEMTTENDEPTFGQNGALLQKSNLDSNVKNVTNQTEPMQQSSFERDLKPYFEKECSKGDVSACTTLEQLENK